MMWIKSGISRSTSNKGLPTYDFIKRSNGVEAIWRIDANTIIGLVQEQV
jgi:hypothetical protein